MSRRLLAIAAVDHPGDAEINPLVDRAEQLIAA
jgi:hypothetical protein